MLFLACSPASRRSKPCKTGLMTKSPISKTLASCNDADITKFPVFTSCTPLASDPVRTSIKASVEPFWKCVFLCSLFDYWTYCKIDPSIFRKIRGINYVAFSYWVVFTQNYTIFNLCHMLRVYCILRFFFQKYPEVYIKLTFS